MSDRSVGDLVGVPDVLPGVAYQGEPGAYGEEAVLGYFGAGRVLPSPRPTFIAACAAAERGEVAAVALPVENSLAGTVGEALDALAATELVIAGELLLPVHHCLLAVRGASIEGIRTVTSHPQALAQCGPRLAAAGWQLVTAADTASGARTVAERGDPTLAAVASRAAAERYGLDVLATDLQGSGVNLTRFIVAGRPGEPMPDAAGPLAPREDAPRSSLVVFETRHVAGALHAAIGAFAAAGVSLSRIESRPTRDSPWRYRFLVQIEADAAEEPAVSALRSLRELAHGVRVLGSFPSAVEGG